MPIYIHKHILSAWVYANQFIVLSDELNRPNIASTNYFQYKLQNTLKTRYISFIYR